MWRRIGWTDVQHWKNALVEDVHQMAASRSGIANVRYDQTEHVSLTRDFLNDRERFMRRLLAPQDE